ncbi:hypothetical protein NLG97_g8299 [Lecanicillium saksenae]|uniref:Uncharacterized protein n=1 Tax=Lecanicillium saksenae TaxID=468837 RepID=A0ACC1QL94_9HYPO|nr:hypothetical protein NLG97_g8299 [Lecanicillium saksenae]
MEAAGLALAVAGLAGQAISGITTLKTFFASYKAASSKVSNFNFELDCLVSSLHDIEQMVQRARREEQGVTGPLPTYGVPQAASWSIARKSLLQDLERRMLKCIEEFKTWNAASKGLSIGVWGDVRTFARKIKIAASKDVFDEIGIRITAHRQAIGHSVTSLTFFTAQDNLSLSLGIQGQLASLTSTSNALLSQHQTAESEQQQQRSQFSEALAKLDTSRRDSHSEQMDLLRSMADNISSIASQVASNASGGSWKPNSGQNSPVVRMGSGRGSPQVAYSPGSLMYAMPPAYGQSNPPLRGGSEASHDQTFEQWHPGPFPAASYPRVEGIRTPPPPPLPPPPDPFWARPGPQSKRKRDEPPSKRERDEPTEIWCCGNVLGIDQLYTDTMRCLFCDVSKKDKYANGYFVDTVAFGRHLVEDHCFGSCNMDETFTSLGQFASHILSYHCNSKSSPWSDPWMSDSLKCFLSKSKKASPSATRPRSPEGVRQEPMVNEQAASTKMLLQTEICCLLQNQGLWAATKGPHLDSIRHRPRGREDFQDNADMDEIMTALRTLESSTETEATKTLYRIACLIEEITVSELSQRLSHRSYQSADHVSVSCPAALEQFTTCSAGGEPPASFTYGHFVTQPILEPKQCRGCVLNAKMMVAYTDLSDLKMHLQMEHAIHDNVWIEEILRDKVRKIPLQLSPAWFPRFPSDGSLANRVDRWMLHCFLASPNWRILMRTHYKQFLSGSVENWTVDVLRHWKDDSTNGLAYTLIELTDGAVNSRDHTVTGSSARGSIARPVDIGTQAGAYACAYHNCMLRFETSVQLYTHTYEAHI